MGQLCLRRECRLSGLLHTHLKKERKPGLFSHSFFHSFTRSANIYPLPGIVLGAPDSLGHALPAFAKLTCWCVSIGVLQRQTDVAVEKNKAGWGEGEFWVPGKWSVLYVKAAVIEGSPRR